MKTTTRLFFFFPVLLMFCTTPSRLKASHLEGLQLTYIHLSGSVYRINLTWYRDCTTTMVALGSVPIHMSSSTCGVNQSVTLYLDTSQSRLITLICPNAFPYCYGGTAPAFEKIVYENDITIPGQCPDWLFDISVASRNNAITTLQNPGGDDIYVVAHLNNSNSENNSPQFTNDPIIFIDMNQDFHYNNGIFDADGDSISYQLVAPMTDAINPCLYIPGYYSLSPCYSIPPVSFDNFTGDLTIHSMANEFAVIAYEVKDWRNGVLMGSVIRDVVMYTGMPWATYPTATGMNGTTQQFLYTFPDDTVCFDVFSDDIDAGDTVTMTWNQTIPNATFVTNGAQHPTGTFCWIPSIADVRSQPYMFTVMVNDNACPVENACIYSYFIYVTLDSSLVFLDAPELSHDSHLSIFPNPSNGIIEIGPGEKISQVTVFDSFGKCILNSRNGRIDLSDLQEGIYYAEVLMQDGKMQYHKIVRQ